MGSFKQSARPEVCPRCLRQMTAQRGALSRTDNKTEVCPECGMDEALEALRGVLTGRGSWPVQH